MVGLEQPQALSFPLQNVSTWWPKGGNFQHLCGWHPCNASCFHYGELSVSAWDMVTLTTVVWGYYQLSLSLSSPSSPSLSDLLLPDATISCSFYFSSWIPFILSFTFVDGIFPEVKERKLCPCLWEKEKDSPNLTPRAYSLEQHFLLEHCEGTTEFVSDNTNTGKSTAELLFAITAYHQHFWLMQSQDQFIWCPRQSPRPRLQKTFSDSTRLHKSEPQGTNPSYGCRVKSLWDLNEWG